MHNAASKYVVVSGLSCLGLISYAFIKFRHFFLIVSFLASSKFSILVFVNFGVVCLVGILFLCSKFFVGRLSSSEIDQAIDSGKTFVMEALFFLVLLSPTLANEEAPFVILGISLSVVVSMKIFHLIINLRIAHMFDIADPDTSSLARILIFLILLIYGDYIGVKIGWANSGHGNSLWTWMLYDFANLLLSGIVTLGKFAFFYIDSQFEAGWAPKTNYIFYLEFVQDAVIAILLMSFATSVFLDDPSRPPIYLFIDAIHVLVSFTQKVKSFLGYRVLMKRIDNAFPDLTEEHLSRTETCVICRDELVADHTCKLLPCGHAFHLTCLKRWFFQQQVCPYCRADVAAATSEEETATDQGEIEQIEIEGTGEDFDETIKDGETSPSSLVESVWNGEIELPGQRRRELAELIDRIYDDLKSTRETTQMFLRRILEREDIETLDSFPDLPSVCPLPSYNLGMDTVR